jgi:mannitol operon transcriptional antiterminator
MALVYTEDPMPTAKVAARLDISPRMVRYRLGQVAAWLTEQGGILRKQPGQGLWIEASREVRDRILARLRELSGYDLVLSPAQRQQIFIFTFLLKDEPTVAKQLECQLGVSRSTLFKDLGQVGAWFATRNLSLVRRPGFGIAVEGAEQDRREALVSILFTHLEQQHLLFICCGGNPQDMSCFLPSASVPPSAVLKFLRSLQIAHARRTIARIEALLRVQFSDDVFTFLVLHVAVLITRIAQGKTVNYSPEVVQSIMEHPCLSAVLEVLGELGRELSLPIPEDEAAYLVTKLIGAQVSRRLPEGVSELPNRVNVAALVEQLVDDAAELLGDPRLAEDRQMVQELTTHLEPFLQRLQFGVATQNPLLEDLKATYPHVYWVAERLSEALAEEVEQPVPEGETGYIAMYLRAALERLRPAPRFRVLVVCPMGAATSHFLACRLRAEFPQLDLVGVLSLRGFLARPLTEADAIISTVASLPVQTHLPMIYVSPLLPSADVARIRQWLVQELPLSRR